MGKTLGADASGEDMILLNHFFIENSVLLTSKRNATCLGPTTHSFITWSLSAWRTGELMNRKYKLKNSLNWTALFVSRELVSLKQHRLAICLPWELLYSNETLEQWPRGTFTALSAQEEYVKATEMNTATHS